MSKKLIAGTGIFGGAILLVLTIIGLRAKPGDLMDTSRTGTGNGATPSVQEKNIEPLSISQDSDKDGLFDVEETRLGRNPKSADFNASGADSDEDGLYDAVEIWFGTDPKKSDSSGDGVSDLSEFEEIQSGTMYGQDTDQDGLTDYSEAKWYGTDPNNPDTDGDNHKDGSEVFNGYNPKGEGKL